MTRNADRENWERCKLVADELEAYAEGRAYADECGEVRVLDDGEEPGEYWEPLSMCDWLEDALDVDVTATLAGSYRGAEVCVAWGGPAIYVDTRREEVRLAWWGETASYGISREAAAELDEVISEQWAACAVPTA